MCELMEHTDMHTSLNILAYGHCSSPHGALLQSLSHSMCAMRENQVRPLFAQAPSRRSDCHPLHSALDTDGRSLHCLYPCTQVCIRRSRHRHPQSTHHRAWTPLDRSCSFDGHRRYRYDRRLQVRPGRCGRLNGKCRCMHLLRVASRFL